MIQILIIAVGGALGAVLRHLAGLAFLRTLGPAFPWGTLFVNVVGSLAMGLLIGWMVKRGGSTEMRLFMATGLLGGFTTFSAFSLDFANLWHRGESLAAFSYVAASLLLSLIAIFIGLWLAKTLA